MVPVPFWKRPPSPFIMWYLWHKPTTSVKFLSESLFHSVSLLSIPLTTRATLTATASSKPTHLARQVLQLCSSSRMPDLFLALPDQNQFVNFQMKQQKQSLLGSWLELHGSQSLNSGELISLQGHTHQCWGVRGARTTLTHCQGACRLVQSLENCQLSAEADHMPPLQPNPSILGMNPTAWEHLRIPGDVYKRHQQQHAEWLRTGTYASWKSITSRTSQYYIHTTEHYTATRMNKLTHKDMDETRRYNVEWKQHTQERSRAEMQAVHNENTNRHKPITHQVTSKWKKR